MDRRALVFAIFAVVCFALYPLADKYDGAAGWAWGDKGWAWVPVILGVVYLLLALLSLLDAHSRSKLEPRPLGYDRDAGLPAGRPVAPRRDEGTDGGDAAPAPTD